MDGDQPVARQPGKKVLLGPLLLTSPAGGAGFVGWPAALPYGRQVRGWGVWLLGGCALAVLVANFWLRHLRRRSPPPIGAVGYYACVVLQNLFFWTMVTVICGVLFVPRWP